jgi:hypothetical protein
MEKTKENKLHAVQVKQMMRNVMVNSKSPKAHKKYIKLQELDSSVNQSHDANKLMKDNYSRVGLQKGYFSRKPG